MKNLLRFAHQAAVAVRNKAYAPYSNFRVGAAVITKTGEIFAGCNVENASYGGTVCAERVAIWKAVSEGYREFAAVVVVTDAAAPAVPCAQCLQVMAEFLPPTAQVHIGNLDSVRMSKRFQQLLPMPFGPAQLRKAVGKASKADGGRGVVRLAR